MAKQELFIPTRMPGLNDYIEVISRHRQAGGKMKKEWTETTAEYASANRLGRFTEPIWINLHWFEPSRRRDKDNVAFAKKFIFDGLKQAGVIKDDGNRFIVGFSDHFHYEGKKEGVLIIMEEVENDKPNVNMVSRVQ